MPTIQSLSKEVASLKRQVTLQKKTISKLQTNQQNLYGWISNLSNKQVHEKTPLIETIVEESPVQAQTSVKPSGGKIATGIIILILGIIFGTFGGGIIGLPLIIIGIIILVKSNDTKGNTVDNQSDDETDNDQIGDTLDSEEPNDDTDDEDTVYKTDDEPASNTVVKKNISKKSSKKTSIEEDIGMKWFSRIGILALVIGVGFFIKYAIDKNWINHLTRIIIAIVVGIAIIVFGEIVQKKKDYKQWGSTLIGGGFAIIYFAVYAMYAFKEYRAAIGITYTIEIILLFLVAFAGVLFALKNNSQIIAAESFILGYLTSFLGGTYDNLTIIYGLILTIGLVVTVSYKKWYAIGTGGVIVSYLMYLFWNIRNPLSFGYSTFILLSFFIVFNFQTLLLSKVKVGNSQNIFVTILNSGLFFVLYYLQLEKYHPDSTGLFALLMSIFYFGAYFYTHNFDQKGLSITHLYLALLFITITIPIELNKELISIVWAFEALLLTILSLKLKNKTLKISSYVVGGITACKTILFDSVKLHELNLVNFLESTRLFSFLATIVCFYAIYIILKRSKLSSDELSLVKVYSWLATGLLVTIILLELFNDYSILVTIILSALSILLVFLGNKNCRELIYQSMGVSIVLFVKLIVHDIPKLGKLNLLHLFKSTRLISFLIAIICFYCIYLILKKKETSLVYSIYSWVATGLLTLIVFIELINNHSVWISIIFAIISLLFVVLSGINYKELRHQSIALSLILFCKLIFYDSWVLPGFNSTNFLKSTRFFAFLVTIIVFYIISWYLEYRKDILTKGEHFLSHLYSYGGTTLAFILVFLEMKEFWISIGWSVLALIIILSGFILRKKHLRIQGMLIFSITILKVFLYDTRNLETLFRTLSYIVLGVVLLGVSFIYTKYKKKLKDIL